MENASKALLIAGAILIVILLIGIGMLIYSKSTGVVDVATNAMNSQEIQAFNSSFISYEGSQKGSTVRALISAIIANNGTHTSDESKQISLVTGAGAGTKDANDMATYSSGINTQQTYTVTLGYSTAGLVNTVTISE